MESTQPLYIKRPLWGRSSKPHYLTAEIIYTARDPVLLDDAVGYHLLVPTSHPAIFHGRTDEVRERNGSCSLESLTF